MHKNQRWCLWIGGLIVGLILGGLVGSYITFIFSTKYIADKVDICTQMNCIRYERVNLNK